MKNYFDFALPLEGGALMTTVRLAVGGVAAAAGLDLDSCEDFKVCVTESLLILRRNGCGSACVHCEFGEGTLTAEVTAENRQGQIAESGIEDEISYALLGALVDEAAFERDGDGGRVTAVRLVKNAL